MVYAEAESLEQEDLDRHETISLSLLTCRV